MDQVQGSSHNPIDWIMDHPKFAALLGIVALAITFSPKASVMGTWICLLIAEGFAIAMLAGFAKEYFPRCPRIVTSIGGFVVALVLAFFGSWLTDAKVQAYELNNPPPTPPFVVADIKPPINLAKTPNAWLETKPGLSKEAAQQLENEHKLNEVFYKTTIRLLDPPNYRGEMFDHIAIEIINNSEYDMGEHTITCNLYSIKGANGNSITDSVIEPEHPRPISRYPLLAGGRGEVESCLVSLVMGSPISCVGVNVGVHFVIPGYNKRRDKWYNYQYIDRSWVQSNLESTSDFCQHHP